MSKMSHRHDADPYRSSGLYEFPDQTAWDFGQGLSGFAKLELVRRKGGFIVQSIREGVMMKDAADEPRDCGDNSCRYAVNRGGMRTNSGCTCDQCPSCGVDLRFLQHRPWCKVGAKELDA